MHRPHHIPERFRPGRRVSIHLPGAYGRIALVALFALTSACGACNPREHERVAPASGREEANARVRTVADETIATIERIESSVDEAAGEVTGAVEPIDENLGRMLGPAAD